MSDYIQAMKDSGIIQKLRESLPKKDQEKFDEIVAEKLKEYNAMWLETKPVINEYQTKVNKYADQPKGEPRRNVQSSDE